MPQASVPRKNVLVHGRTVYRHCDYVIDTKSLTISILVPQAEELIWQFQPVDKLFRSFRVSSGVQAATFVTRFAAVVTASL